MTNYENGSNFERAIKKLYESQGFQALRSAGSKSPVDVIAWKCDENGFGRVVLIQCKKERRKNSYKDDEDGFRAVSAEAGWEKLMFIKRSGKVEVRKILPKCVEIVDTFSVKVLKEE